MRHAVPVDRQPGAADVRAAREPNAFAIRQLLEPGLPIRGLDYFVDAQTETDAADSKIVSGDRVGLDKVPPAHRDWIKLELFSYFVDLDFNGEPRLGRAVAAFRSAGWFIGEHAQPFEFVARHIVGHRL